MPSNMRPQSAGSIYERGRATSRMSDLSDDEHIRFIPVSRVRPHSTGDIPNSPSDDSLYDLSFIELNLRSIARNAMESTNVGEAESPIKAKQNNIAAAENIRKPSVAKTTTTAPARETSRSTDTSRNTSKACSQKTHSRNHSASSATSSSIHLSEYTLDLNALDKDSDGGRDQFYEDSRLARNATFVFHPKRPAVGREGGPEDFTLEILDHMGRSRSNSGTRHSRSSSTASKSGATGGAPKLAALTAELEKLNEQLQTALTEARKSKEKSEKVDRALRETEQELGDAYEDLRESTKELIETKAELKETKNELSEASAMVQCKIEIATQNEIDLRYLKAELKTTKHELSESHEQLGQVKEDLEETEIEMESLRSQWTATKASLERTDSKLKQTKTEWAAARRQAEDEKRAKQEASLQLHHAASDLIDTKQELDTAHKDLENARNALVRLQKEHKKEKSAKSGSMKDMRTKADSEIKALRQQLEAAKAEIAQAKDDLSASDEETNYEIFALKKEVEAAKAETARAKDDLSASDEDADYEIMALKKELEASKAETSQALEDLSALKEENKRLKLDTTATGQHSKSQEKANAKIKQLEDELAIARDEIEVERLTTSLSESSDDQKYEQLKQAKKELKLLREDLAASEERAENLAIELREKPSWVELAANETALEETRSELRKTKVALDNAQSTLPNQKRRATAPVASSIPTARVVSTTRKASTTKNTSNTQFSPPTLKTQQSPSAKVAPRQLEGNLLQSKLEATERGRSLLADELMAKAEAALSEARARLRSVKDEEVQARQKLAASRKDLERAQRGAPALDARTEVWEKHRIFVEYNNQKVSEDWKIVNDNISEKERCKSDVLSKQRELRQTKDSIVRASS